jgi:microcystin-dependent protein
MGDVFVGEVRALPFGFTPAGWAPCQGQLLPIGQYTALYSLIGNMYGGDGKTTYGLPNLAPLPATDGGTLRYCIALQGIYPQQG